jgi:hypothetical protein
MLKPLTLSLSLVVALGASSVSMAGLFDGHHGAMASPQGVIASPQEIMPSAQCDTGGCGDVCAPAKKKCNLLGFLHKPKSYSYTWVLKKKRIRGHHGGGDCGGIVDGGCDSCGTGAVYPSGQYASPQAYGSGQSYGSPQAYGSGQAYSAPSTYGSGQAYGGSSGQAYGGSSGQAYGAGQAHSAPQPTSTSAPAGEMTPAPAGDEAPPAPEVPSAPDAPEAPTPNAPQSSLLFSTPSGN